MKTQCEICLKDTNNYLVYCCYGNDCSCGGNAVNESEDYVCADCLLIDGFIQDIFLVYEIPIDKQKTAFKVIREHKDIFKGLEL
jgi:hypothetical protein